jgi:serine/threonine-protein kinase
MVGRLLIELDLLDEGIAELERALALEPGMLTAQVEIARALALKGDWDRAWPMVEGDTFAHLTHKARFLLWNDRFAETEALITDAEKRFPLIGGFRRLAETGPPPSQTLSGPRRARRDLFFLQLSAELAGAQGKHELAVTAVTRAVDQGLFDLAWLDRCPILERVRRDPRFATLRPQVASRARAIAAVLLG